MEHQTRPLAGSHSSKRVAHVPRSPVILYCTAGCPARFTRPIGGRVVGTQAPRLPRRHHIASRGFLRPFATGHLVAAVPANRRVV